MEEPDLGTNIISLLSLRFLDIDLKKLLEKQVFRNKGSRKKRIFYGQANRKGEWRVSPLGPYHRKCENFNSFFFIKVRFFGTQNTFYLSVGSTLTVKYPLFFYASPREAAKYYLKDFFRQGGAPLPPHNGKSEQTSQRPETI